MNAAGIERLGRTQYKCQLIAGESSSPNPENKSNIIQFIKQNLLLKSNNNKYTANSLVSTIYQYNMSYEFIEFMTISIIITSLLL